MKPSGDDDCRVLLPLLPLSLFHQGGHSVLQSVGGGPAGKGREGGREGGRKEVRREKG